MAGISLNPLSQKDTQAPSELTQVIAQPQDNFVNPAVSDASRLGASLQDFLPHAGALADKLDHNNQYEAKTLGATQASLEADPYSAMANIDSLKNPDSVAPVYAKFFTQGYRQSIGQSIASKSRDDFLTKYEANKNRPDFNPDTFVQEFKVGEFSGISDPEILTSLHKSFVATEEAMRTDYRAKVHTDLVEASKQHIQESITGLLTADQSPLQLHDKMITDILPSIIDQGVLTKPEAIKFMIDHVNNMSQAAGGDPSMFDSFTAKDSQGHSLQDVDPVLANLVEDARHKASLQRDSKLTNDQLKINANTNAWLHDQIKNGNFSRITDEELQQHIGLKSVFNTDDAYQSFRALRDKAIDAQGLLQRNLVAANSNLLGLQPPEEQKKTLTALTKGNTDSILQAISTNDPNALEVVSKNINEIIYKRSASGASVGVEALDGMFNSLTTDPPKTDGTVPTKFLALVSAYKQIKDSPNSSLLDSLQTDTKQMLEDYIKSSTEGGSLTADAYTSAYRGINPEAKKFAESQLNTPEAKKELDSRVNSIFTSHILGDSPTGSPFFSGSIGNRPDMQNETKLEAERYLRGNYMRGVSDDDLKAHLEGWAKRNYVYNSASESYVQVPPAMNSEATQKSISATTQYFSNKYGKDAGVYLQYMGGDRYQAMSKVGGHALGKSITLKQMNEGHIASTTLIGDEGKRLAILKAKANNGTLTTADVTIEGGLITKAINNGILDKNHFWQSNPELKAIQAKQRGDLPHGVTSYPTQSYDGIEGGNLPPTAAKGSISSRFMASKDYYGALTAQGEGVVLNATQGLARGEGNNIGLGYNLKANVNTLHSDFKQAGIPEEGISDILTGKRNITEDQAMRLYKVTQPRYEAMAKDAYTKATFNPMSGETKEYDKLPPQVKAVLTDIAYQSGTGVLKSSKGREGLQAFATGDWKKAMENLQVTYKENKTGLNVVDTGRHNKRIAMLNSAKGFEALINHVAQKPTNLIQAQVAMAK